MTFRCSWGTGIAATYLTFVVLTGGFVAFAMGRPVSLVRADYYAESLRQDGRMNAVANARGLVTSAPLVRLEARDLVISLPYDQAPGVRGTVTFYRASDPAADRVYELAPGADGRQRVSTTGMPIGHWLVQLAWTAGGREYYDEQAVVIR
jgi:hypothetical protein